jgi:hypothetical protein
VAVVRITPSGQITTFTNGLNVGSAPNELTAGPDGNLWFTDVGTTRAIGRITPGGQITEFSTGLPATSRPLSISAGPDGNLWFDDDGATPAIGRITPAGQITEYSAGLQAGNASYPLDITAGPDGDLWFTDEGTTRALGRITPSGQITEFTAGLEGNNASAPAELTAGPDGSIWFIDQGSPNAIGRIGTGVQAAAVQAPSVTGSGESGTRQVCEGAEWSPWDDQLPSASAFGYDGFQWLLNGAPITGQTAQTYTPTSGDVGGTLTCTETVTYPLLDVTTSATSPSAPVIAASAGPAGAPGPTGAMGTAGTNGSNGTNGAQGPAGSAGEIELVTCSSVKVKVTVKGKIQTKTVKRCTTKLIASPQRFTAAMVRAELSRAGRVVATGRVAGGHLRLHSLRPLPAGRYLLTVFSAGGRHAHVTRRQVQVG